MTNWMVPLLSCWLSLPATAAEYREVKGGPALPAWGLEISVGYGNHVNDGYVERLSDFNFEKPITFFDNSRHYVRISLSITHTLTRYFAVLLRFQNLDTTRLDYERQYWTPHVESTEHFSWRTYAVAAYLRGQLPLWGGKFTPYVQSGIGLGFGSTHFTTLDDSEQECTLRERHVGFVFGALGGLQFHPWKHVGFVLEGGYLMAPIIDNLLGDTHDSGGLFVAGGLRLAL